MSCCYFGMLYKRSLVLQENKYSFIDNHINVLPNESDVRYCGIKFGNVIERNAIALPAIARTYT